MWTVAAFTDTYLPTVNGVTYTVRTWRDRWRRLGGTMAVVYPDGRTDGYRPASGEFPVSSVRFPFYPGYRFGRPTVPEGLSRIEPDVVHAHTPFALGLAARRFARREDLPLVASYHTPTGEYANYISDSFAEVVRRAAERYERWFFGSADAVVVPSEIAREGVETGSTPVFVVSNGVDTELFAPASDAEVAAFRDRHGLPDGPIVGYTGRHGYEKRLGDLLSATVGIDATLVLAGDGPARPELKRRAAAREDVRFLGFLDRTELPAFYSALDVFAFPSPVETQGLVALESIACGTPVVAVAAGALTETVTDGETGYHYDPHDVEGFRAAIRRALSDSERLSATCLRTRSTLDVRHSLSDLADVYRSVSSDDRRSGR